MYKVKEFFDDLVFRVKVFASTKKGKRILIALGVIAILMLLGIITGGCK